MFFKHGFYGFSDHFGVNDIHILKIIQIIFLFVSSQTFLLYVFLKSINFRSYIYQYISNIYLLIILVTNISVSETGTVTVLIFLCRSCYTKIQIIPQRLNCKHHRNRITLLVGTNSVASCDSLGRRSKHLPWPTGCYWFNLLTLFTWATFPEVSMNHSTYSLLTYYFLLKTFLSLSQQLTTHLPSGLS